MTVRGGVGATQGSITFFMGQGASQGREVGSLTGYVGGERNDAAKHPYVYGRWGDSQWCLIGSWAGRTQEESLVSWKGARIVSVLTTIIVHKILCIKSHHLVIPLHQKFR